MVNLFLEVAADFHDCNNCEDGKNMVDIAAASLYMGLWDVEQNLQRKFSKIELTDVGIPSSVMGKLLKVVLVAW